LSPSHLLLSPGHVAVAGGGRYRERPAAEAGGALKALAELLREEGLTGRADVVLSHKLAPVWLVPSAPTRLDWRETGGWVRDRLTSQFGEPADKWHLSWQPAPPGEPILVSGVESTWLLELLALLKTAGIHPTCVRPWLSAACRRHRGPLGRGSAWLALAEPGRLTLAGLRRGRVESLRTGPCTDDPAAELAAMVEREALLDSRAAPDRVWLQSVHVEADWQRASGLEFKPLTSARAGLGAMLGA